MIFSLRILLAHNNTTKWHQLIIGIISKYITASKSPEYINSFCFNFTVVPTTKQLFRSATKLVECALCLCS